MKKEKKGRRDLSEVGSSVAQTDLPDLTFPNLTASKYDTELREIRRSGDFEALKL